MMGYKAAAVNGCRVDDGSIISDASSCSNGNEWRYERIILADT
jgi:hypothetical protein